jgi:hypothetical protein
MHQQIKLLNQPLDLNLPIQIMSNHTCLVEGGFEVPYPKKKTQKHETFCIHFNMKFNMINS